MVARLTGFLLALAILCSLGVVASQHQARKLYAAMELEQQNTQQLDEEWGRLQIEQRTWAGHARVEKLARERLLMKQPVPGQILLLEERP
jgi:cell division protein FtsL